MSNLTMDKVMSTIQIASEKRDRAIIAAQATIITAHETYGKDLEIQLKALAGSAVADEQLGLPVTSPQVIP